MKLRKPFLVGASVAAVAVSAGGLGLASAATGNTNSGTSLVDKIASKFNLNKSDVQAVFDQNRADHETQMKANLKQHLAQAVTDGKLTQAQSDHITSALTDIDKLRGDTPPNQLSDSVKQQIKTKLDDLRKWAKDNNIDRSLIGPIGHRGGRGPGLDTGSDSSGTN